MDSERDYFRFVIPLNPNQSQQSELSSQSQSQSTKVIQFRYQKNQTGVKGQQKMMNDEQQNEENIQLRFKQDKVQQEQQQYPSLSSKKQHRQTSPISNPLPNLHQINPFTLYSSRRGKHSNLNSGIVSNTNLHSKQPKGSNQYASNLTLVESFNTLQDFFYIYGSIRTPSECPVDTKVFFFKKECKPIWQEWLDSGCLLLQFRNNNKVETTMKNDNQFTGQNENQQGQIKDAIGHGIDHQTKQQFQASKLTDQTDKRGFQQKTLPKQKDPQGLIDHIWQFLLFHLIGNLLHSDVIGICLCKRQKITLIQIWLSRQNNSKNIGIQIESLIQRQITSLVCPGLANAFNEQDQKLSKNLANNPKSPVSKGPPSPSKIKNKNSKNSSISQVIPYTSSTSGIVSVKYKRHRDSINSQSTMKGALNLPHKNSKKKDPIKNQRQKQSDKNDKHFGFFRPAVPHLNQTF